ncbi:MAG: beta-ketoacyl-[acyl-carrier-protein] synthase family protein [Gemmatimonadota bacterium]|nr:MAG: beta-ketoacyl-[acyl-carrier-protein] synthase family protein [Gemmatimonadota bacterium]
MNPRTVWVTGVGAVTAAGPGRDDLARAVATTDSFVRPHGELGGARVASVDFNATGARRLDRTARLFKQAAEEAWRDADLLDGAFLPHRCGAIEGSSLGPTAELLTTLHSGCSERMRHRPSNLIRFMPGAGAATFAMERGIAGPVMHLSVGSVSGATAIGEGFLKVASGQLDIAVVGGAECPLHTRVLGTFEAAGVLSPSRDGVVPCMPFDAERGGTVLGEGSAVLILELREHAEARGVGPLVELAGFGTATEGHSMVAPSPDGCGVRHAARQALDGFDRAELGWIKCHGTGTPLNDAAEYQGLQGLFGPGLAELPMTSLKPMLGHCLGASGAVEAAATVLAMRERLVPATLGTRRVDPHFDYCSLVKEPREAPPGAVLALSESFGGRCAALVFAEAT